MARPEHLLNQVEFGPGKELVQVDRFGTPLLHLDLVSRRHLDRLPRTLQAGTLSDWVVDSDLGNDLVNIFAGIGEELQIVRRLQAQSARRLSPEMVANCIR